ncbi:hypothetical protein CIK05_06960 [Bdellovibrio sp. qaytius]|nr:hypothetical protein CIK05_06960 [Bdellovibrio sp. qaytius]
MTSEKNLKFNVPGKTFLVGEYAVLAGGSCLGLGTNPSFSILPVVNGQTFHPESPAGLYLHKKSIENFTHEFINPYGVGGFGASTAEFIFSYYSNPHAVKNLHEAFETYLGLFTDRKEQKPSGADLLTQLVGGISHIDLAKQLPVVEKLNWNFTDLEFLIYSTGLKVKTHEHLASLDRNLCHQLVKPSAEVVAAFKSEDSRTFTQALSAWSDKLEQMGLAAKPVTELKRYIEQQIPGVLVKPCGALGADVVVILCSKLAKKHVLEQIELLNIKGLNFQADSQQLTNGPLSI